jgi:glycerate kinase
LGAGLAAFFGADLRGGLGEIARLIGLEEALVGADLCITGEGSLDEQSLVGKATVSVARLCARQGVPCVAVCGRVELTTDALQAQGIRDAIGLGGIRDAGLSGGLEEVRSATARLLQGSAPAP